ncbi:hypothetical protein QR680_002082 [Steinernema hermaphroditum]|uniref:Uncharacterized protein n=1 Tax=Steinernema hermaphroditum TaxID=289476 RepID=A0AA39H151_9BILA|nr:hypothetical protein QR680_002082 [Steinernema hermaphroditum]
MANLESRIPGPPVGYCSSSEDEGDSPALNVVKDDDAHQAKAMNGFLNTGIAEMAKRGMLSGRKEEEHNDSDLELDDDVVREADLRFATLCMPQEMRAQNFRGGSFARDF